ncbi:unnamed protein product, partial [Rodentolepis nana]|uniref:Uncharacterized protein n=1 Tax=Rodentolepis nana TaxID=102285 RepID=A0A0R3TLW7_RODNA
GIIRSPIASPLTSLSVRTIKLPVGGSHSLSSGRISRLASRVDTMSIVETRSFYRIPPPIAVSPPGLLLNMDDCALPKSFTPSPTLSFMDGGEAPWYRLHRPTAPIHPASDFVEASSPLANQTPGTSVGLNLDQENLSPPQPPSASPIFVQPLTSVSNILQTPVIFGERLPKWSVLRRSESNPLSPPQPTLRSSASAELLNQISRSSPLRGEEGHPYHLVANSTVTTTVSSRDSPQTPPISVFDRRRSWFTSRAAPGVTRPRVLKHGPVLPLDIVASRSSDLISLKRSATNGLNSYEESVIKKSRIHSLVPSERSAFLPVAHSGCRRPNGPDGLIVASSTVASPTPSNCCSFSMDTDNNYDDDQEKISLSLLPPPPLPSNSI